MSNLATAPEFEARLVSVENAGRILGISRSSVYGLLADGSLRAVKLRGRRLVVRESIDSLIDTVTAD